MGGETIQGLVVSKSKHKTDTVFLTPVHEIGLDILTTEVVLNELFFVFSKSSY